MSFLRAGFKKDIFLWNLPRTGKYGTPPTQIGNLHSPAPLHAKSVWKTFSGGSGGVGGTPIRPNNYFD